MRTPVVIAGSLSAGALLIALAGPVVAAPGVGPASGTCTGSGPVASSTMAHGAGMGALTRSRATTGTRMQQHMTAPEQRRGRGTVAGTRAGAGTGKAGAGATATPRRSGTPGATTQPSGTLTAAQRTALAAMAEEEKMAHDVYVTLGARYPELMQFSRIAVSEAQHLAALRSLMTRYGITDPTLGAEVGEFESARMQSLYGSLVDGATTPAAALDAGVTIEKTDIADITSTMVGVTAQDVLTVYGNLRTASQHHLAAFSR